MTILASAYDWSNTLLSFLPAENDPFASTAPPQLRKWNPINTPTASITVSLSPLINSPKSRGSLEISTKIKPTSSLPSLTTQADRLFEEKKTLEAKNLLEQAAQSRPKDPEILWRLSRSYYDLSETKPDDSAWRQEWLKKGQSAATTALSESPDHFNSHKWLAFNSSGLTPYQPRDEKITTAHKVKEHAEKAVQLNPHDADVHYLLGRWKYNVASVGWFERTAARLPATDYNDALQDFLKAQKLNENLLRNNVFLGDTYRALNQNTEAKKFYERVMKQTPKNNMERTLLDEVQKKMTSM